MARFYHTGLVELGVEAFTGKLHSFFFSVNCRSYKLNTYPAPESYHIPCAETVDGALDLFSLCFLVIFGNVLDFRTYSTPDRRPLKKTNLHDVNGIGIEERYNMCTARGVCIKLLRWWSSKYRLRHNHVRCIDPSFETTGHAKTYDDFPITFLLEEAALLLEYKSRAQRGKRPGAKGCTARKLRHQILNVLQLFGQDAIDHWDTLVDASPELCDGEQLSMGGPKKEYLEVVELDLPQAFRKGHFFFFNYWIHL